MEPESEPTTSVTSEDKNATSADTPAMNIGELF